MKYLSTHKVLAKGTKKVYLPAFLSFFALFPLAIFIMAALSSTLGIIVLILSLIAPIFIYQHFYLQWLAWAVKTVNDIPQFLKEGSGSYQLININRFPAVKTFLPYKDKKKEIENTVFERQEKGLYVVEFDNVPYFSETHFYKSIPYYGGFFLLGLFILFVGLFIVPWEVDGLWVKLICTAIGLPIVFWALKNLLDREPVFSISKFGVKTRKQDLQWSEIEDITVVRNRSGTGRQQYIKEDIKITYREKDGILNTAKVDISSLNTSIAKADEVIKGYKQKYLTKLTVQYVFN